MTGSTTIVMGKSTKQVHWVPHLWFFDDDLDGYGAGTGVLACSTPSDYVANALDCDDTDISISPAATEVCDGGVDNNCNGLSDDQDESRQWNNLVSGLRSGWFGGTQFTTTACLALYRLCGRQFRL